MTLVKAQLQLLNNARILSFQVAFVVLAKHKYIQWFTKVFQGDSSCFRESVYIE